MTETVTVTASAVRAELTRLLAAVSDGKRVEITKHGKVVACLISAEAETEAEVETSEVESDGTSESTDAHIWGWTPDEEEAFERFLESEEEDEYEDLLETA